MPNREYAPIGAPCWADLWTSDVEGSRRFYSELLGWEAQEPSPEFGGYFMFHRDGVPVAGCMGDMGDMPADNRWKVYLASADVATTVEAAGSKGGAVRVPPTPVADLGKQTVLLDSGGATIGAWEAGTFPGFTVLGEIGAPAWFELLTRSYDSSLDFYGSVFGWETEVVADTDEFRYSTMVDRDDRSPLAGIMDASSHLGEGAPSYWSIYWGVADVDSAASDTIRLGGSVVAEPQDSPYGRMATVTDPTGGEFRLHSPLPS
ncbi:MAG: VOC family protein [Acidimicrobiales bacterium]|jgi:predicted enzyme related to lactoylglutathione lyase